MDGRIWEALHVAHALARSGEFDLVHNHLDWLPLAFAAHFGHRSSPRFMASPGAESFPPM